MKFTLRGLFRVSQFAPSNDLSMGGITINTFRAISSALLLVNLEITKKLEKKKLRLKLLIQFQFDRLISSARAKMIMIFELPCPL